MAGKPLGKRAMTATERQQRWRKKKRIEKKPGFDWDTRFALKSANESVRLARQLLRRGRPDAEHIDEVLAAAEASLEWLGPK
jgi:hypothetical protein